MTQQSRVAAVDVTEFTRIRGKAPHAQKVTIVTGKHPQTHQKVCVVQYPHSLEILFLEGEESSEDKLQLLLGS